MLSKFMGYLMEITYNFWYLILSLNDYLFLSCIYEINEIIQLIHFCSDVLHKLDLIILMTYFFEESITHQSQINHTSITCQLHINRMSITYQLHVNTSIMYQ